MPLEGSTEKMEGGACDAPPIGSAPSAPITHGPVSAMCSCLFHLTEGQKVDACYPSDALDEEELRVIAMHAFPVRETPLRASPPPPAERTAARAAVS